ncbi:MAG: hypothetical protein JO168_12175 [Solirubrobacterales bacterium]|nr:hypothetical protein [Solirubrobacterales bacterium]MBV9716295.1 hypothetical protein [Solirubrobacterales bacterium]
MSYCLRARRVPVVVALAAALIPSSGGALAAGRRVLRAAVPGHRLARTALLPCPTADYTLQAVAERLDAADLGIAWFALRGSYSCRLDLPLRFAVQPASDTAAQPLGTLGGVQGSPSMVMVHASLTPGAVVIRAWAWTNWCGPGGRFTLLARSSASSNSWTGPVAAPDCSSPELPSTLTPSILNLPGCPPRGYSLSTYGGEGFRQRIIGYAAIVSRGGSPCILRARLSLTVQEMRAHGWATAPEIRGNSASTTVAVVLARGSPAELFWSWTNWCGGGGPFRWLVRAGQQSATARAARVPACDPSGSASTLQPFFNPPYPVPPSRRLKY